MGRITMQQNAPIRDVDEMNDRLMIDIYKKRILERKLHPKVLKGSWLEARDLLVAHFGKLSGIMEVNKYKLLTLYQISIMELQMD
jgi:hypothetical protein